ncbi:MAG TPA: ABC transporter permease [Acetobacteraceae bacterium]|nr:ABC transporter permease [Acetobacteraceae bacterium]
MREPARGVAARLREVRIRRERSGVWILNVVILVLLAFAAPNFYTLGNIAAVLNDAAILGIGAAGMTVLIIAGAFDLSVTAIMGLAPIVALTVAGDASGLAIVLVSVLTGAALGLVNGLVITRGRVAPFVATLGTLFVFGSIGAIISNGNALPVTNGLVLLLGTGAVFDAIPYSFLIMLGVCGLCYVLLRRLHMGRWVRAAGSNLRAAHVSGIDLHLVYLGIFILSGALTGLAGIILTGYLASAVATQAPNYNLNAIAAVVVGGTSLFGGEGTLLGTVLASWLFAVVNNGLILLGVNSYWQYLATGVILVLALALGLLGMGGTLWHRRGALARE